MSLMPLFKGRKNHPRRLQNPAPTKITTHQSQTNQEQLDFHDPPPIITSQFKTNRGEHDLNNHPPTTLFTHQSQINQGRYNLYDPLTTRIMHQLQTSRGQQDLYDPSHQFYLETPRSLIAPAPSFPHELPSLAQIDYKETPEAHVFRANLHGYKKEEVKIQVENDRILKITGEKKLVQKEYDNWHHFQRRIGKFSTVFNLPEDARVDKMKSSMENGVLTVTVPKKGVPKKSHAQTADFCAGDLEALSRELEVSENARKLFAGIAKLGQISTISKPIHIQAFSHLLTLLTHRYPKTRQVSAEEVYRVLLQNGTLVRGDQLEKALDIIVETCWEGDVQEAKGKRLELYAMCNIDVGNK